MATRPHGGPCVREEMNLSDKCCLIYDHGQFFCVAERLSRDFGRTLYHCPWKGSYPDSRNLQVGRGYDGVERVANFFDHIAEADLIVFPDAYDADLEEHLRSQDKRVWGGGRATALELDRLGARRLQEDLGLPCPETRLVSGLDELRKELAESKTKHWIKPAVTRGDFETFGHEDYSLTAPLLDKMESDLGPLAADYGFIVEDNLDGCEVACDGWTVNGVNLAPCGYGYRVGNGYVGKVAHELPRPLRLVNTAYAPVFEKHQSRCCFSFECLVDNGKPYVIDPAIRFSSMPVEVWVELWKNFSEVLWQGAGGKPIEPEPTGRYYAETVVHCGHSALGTWSALRFDAKECERKWLKVWRPCIINGQLYRVPSAQSSTEVGAVCAVGDSLEEAVEVCNERADRISGFEIKAAPLDLKAVEAKIEEGREHGVEW